MAEARDVGVPQLEKLLEPLPEHATLVYVNDPGVEPEPFLYQAVHRRLEAGGVAVLALTSRSPAAALKAMRDLGLDVQPHRERLVFLDAFSAMMGTMSDAKYAAMSPGNVEEFATLLERAARDQPAALLAIDSLSQLADQSSWERLAAGVPRILQAMRRFDVAAAGFTRWPYSGDVDGLLSAFDAVVSLRGVEERVMLSQYFRVERATWKDPLDAKPRLYKSLKPGGVHVYIPKIVVTGPYNAGKSSFVHSVSDQAVSVDQLGTTVALDHGRVTLDGLAADLFGTPGQSRFDP
ncbi:MAG TPA: GTPase, partial [Candidatus Thermoplasmatota archaeon]|nr:GTPase [Candidatus Thermoplasmatota archaeon]